MRRFLIVSAVASSPLLVAPPTSLAHAAPKDLGPAKKVPPDAQTSLALPAPDVELRLDPPAGTTAWRMTVTNKGTVPLLLVADARLLRLSFELPEAPDAVAKNGKKPAAPKPIECSLPGSMREDGRTLVLPPGAKYVESFDLRLFCLDAVEKLLPGTRVTARLGWSAPAPKKGQPAPKAPFVVTQVPAAGTPPSVAAAKEIGAASFTLESAPTLAAKAPASLSPLEAKGGGARSFTTAKQVEASLVLKNVSSESKLVYARPQLVDAIVVDPRGSKVSCTGPALTPAPILDFATKLAPGASWSTTVPLATWCPPGTFDVPGLYLVTPAVHLPKMPDVKGDYSGEVAARTPQLVRVETGSAPFHGSVAAVAKP